MLIAAAISILAFRAPDPPKVAVLPWTYVGGTDTAMKTGKDVLGALFEGVNYEVVPIARTKTAWETDHKPIKEVLEEKDSDPDLPTAKELLHLGRTMHVDFVCAGRARWHTKSVWVGTGPKTKAECIVDEIIVDVKKGEIALDAEKVKADDTKRESGLETAAAILVTAGFNAFSGGPKTPHQQQSVSQAIGLAMEPWLKSVKHKSNKIGD